MGSSLKVQARLAEKEAVWFTQRLSDTKKTPSELIVELVKDRIELEENPFKFLAKKKMERPTKKVNGFSTLIPDFSQAQIQVTKEGEIKVDL